MRLKTKKKISEKMKHSKSKNTKGNIISKSIPWGKWEPTPRRHNYQAEVQNNLKPEEPDCNFNSRINLNNRIN